MHLQETPVWFLGQEVLLEKDRLLTPRFLGFPGDSDYKEFTCSAGDLGSILGLRRSPGRGHGNPLQYSCLENLHGQRSLVAYSPWGCKESDMTAWLSTAHHQLVGTLFDPVKGLGRWMVPKENDWHARYSPQIKELHPPNPILNHIQLLNRHTWCHPNTRSLGSKAFGYFFPLFHPSWWGLSDFHHFKVLIFISSMG